MSELVALLDVQRLDNTIDQLRYKREHLPERAAIAELDGEIAAVNAESAETLATRDELRRQERDLEAESRDVADKAASLDAKLYGGMVTSPKEATAMTEEIANLKARGSGLEDQALELLVEIEPLDEILVIAEAKRGEFESKRAGHQETLAAAEAELDAEIVVLEGERTTAAAALPEKRLEQYRKMRITYGPDAVVEFDPAHNGGCPVAMSAVELDRWKHLPAGTLEPCSDCGRLVAKLV